MNFKMTGCTCEPGTAGPSFFTPGNIHTSECLREERNFWWKLADSSTRTPGTTQFYLDRVQAIDKELERRTADVKKGRQRYGHLTLDELKIKQEFTYDYAKAMAAKGLWSGVRYADGVLREVVGELLLDLQLVQRQVPVALTALPVPLGYVEVTEIGSGKRQLLRADSGPYGVKQMTAYEMVALADKMAALADKPDEYQKALDFLDCQIAASVLGVTAGPSNTIHFNATVPKAEVLPAPEPTPFEKDADIYSDVTDRSINGCKDWTYARWREEYMATGKDWPLEQMIEKVSDTTPSRLLDGDKAPARGRVITWYDHDGRPHEYVKPPRQFKNPCGQPWSGIDTAFASCLSLLVLSLILMLFL